MYFAHAIHIAGSVHLYVLQSTEWFRVSWRKEDHFTYDREHLRGDHSHKWLMVLELILYLSLCSILKFHCLYILSAASINCK
jgi:hypothetical protein